MTTDVNVEALSPDLADDLLEFLEATTRGVGMITAGLAVGWSPHKTRTMLLDEEVKALYAECRIVKTETIEQRVWELADRGNLRAAELYLYCQASERGWKPPAQRLQIGSTSIVKVEIVETARQAALAMIERGDFAALQPGGRLDEHIVDAETVDDAQAV